MPEPATVVTRHRASSRVLLQDRDGRLLMLLTRYSSERDDARWLIPGGGLDAGENHHDGAVRELWEETGLSVPELGPPIWTRDWTYQHPDAEFDTGHAEIYRWVVDQAFDPDRRGWTPEEHLDVIDVRWWTLDELLESGEVYSPPELVDIVAAARSIAS